MIILRESEIFQAYHGTRGGFDEFDFEFSSYPGLDTAFFTSSIEHAQNFGGVWLCELISRRPKKIQWTDPNKRMSLSNAMGELARLFKQAKQEGFDLLVVNGFRDISYKVTLYLPTRPDQIKVVDKFGSA